jgi:hypothetical protein
MSVLVLDQFTAIDGTNLNGRSPSPTNTVSATWGAALGTWQITGNKAVVASGASENILYLDVTAGNADNSYIAKITWATGKAGGIFCNASSANDLWLLTQVPGGGTAGADAWILYERVSGTYNQRAAADVSAFVNGQVYEAKLVTSGDAITGYVDGAQVLTYTTAGRAGKTATLAGLRTVGVGIAWDDFQVGEAAAPGGVGMVVPRRSRRSLARIWR